MKIFKITRKSWNVLMALTLMAAGLFGFVKINDVVASSTPITLPGGTSSQGAYDAYEVGADSPAAVGKVGYVKSREEKVSIDKPLGFYVQERPNVKTSALSFYEHTDGTIYSSAYFGNTSPIYANALKTNASFLLDGWKQIDFPRQGDTFVIALKKQVNINAGRIHYINVRDVITVDSGLNVLSRNLIGNLPAQTDAYALTEGENGYFHSFRGNSLSIAKTYDWAYVFEYNYATNSVGKKIKVKYPVALDSRHNRVDTGIVQPMGTNKILTTISRAYDVNFGGGTWVPSHISLVFVDSTSGTDVTTLVADNAGGYNVLGLSKEGNAIVFDNSKQEFLVIDNTGNIISSKTKSFKNENATFTKFISLELEDQSVEYVAVGNAKATGQFSGYSQNGGVVFAFLDKDLTVKNAKFIESNTIHQINQIQESVDEKRLLISGMTLNGVGDVFSKHYNSQGSGNYAAFFGKLDYSQDSSPSLPTVQTMNIRLDGTQDASTIDTTMLAPLKKAMSSNSANIEANRLDDMTTNAKLFERVNKNVLNPDYKTTPIDWSKLGLTATTHPVTGNTTYEAGPNTDVTFFVNDESMNETVTSGLVNVLDENTSVDPSDAYALKANNVRVHLNDVSSLNLKTAAQVKAWKLGDGTIQTNTVTSDVASVPAAVGVYPVTFNYTNVSRTIYVSVYDDNTVGGPTTTDPLNPVNTELMHAVGGTYRLSEVSGKTLSDITGVKAWNVNTGADSLFTTAISIAGETKPFNNRVPGVYDVVYTTSAGTTKTVQVTLVTGNLPTLTINPPTIELAVGDPVPNLLTGVSASDTESGNLTAQVITSGSVSTATKGIYYIEYSVTDGDFNTVTGLRSYVVGANSVGTNYAIFADSFTKHISQVNTSDIAIITAANAHAEHLKEQTSGTVRVTSLGGYTATPGGYVIGFDVSEEPTTATTAVANVVDGGVVGPTYAIEAHDVTMRVAEVAGRTPLQLVGAKAWNSQTASDETSGLTYTSSPAFALSEGTYTITMSIGSGATLQTLTKTITLQAGGAPSLTINPPQVLVSLGGSVSLMDGVTSNDPEEGNITGRITTSGSVDTTTQGVYHITYSVTDNDLNTATGVRTYIVGNNPVVGATHVLFAENFTVHVDAVDVDPDNIKSEASAHAYKLSTGVESAVSVISTGGYQAVVGPYTVQFAVTDELTTTKAVIASVYAFGDPSGIEIVEAQDVTMRKSLAAGIPLKTLVGAKAWNKNTGLTVGTTATATPIYTGAVGTYATTVKTTTALATTKAVTVNITAGDKPVLVDTTPVVDVLLDSSAPTIRANMTASDTEDGVITSSITLTGDSINTALPGIYHVHYDVEDADGNVADTVTRVYVVGAKTVSGDYAIFAASFQKRVGQVDASHSAVLLAANATGVNIQTKQPVNLQLDALGGYQAAVGGYNIDMSVVGEPSVTAQITATVVAGNKPILSDTTPVVSLELGAVAPTLDADITANDSEDGNITGAITVGGEAVNTALQGIYHVTYNVTDSDGNAADTLTRVYVVDAKVVDQNYAIFANPFTKRVGEVNTSNGAIIESADATAVNVQTKQPATIQVKDAGGYSALPATYPITFTISQNTAVEATISATVITGDKPAISDTTPVVELPVGATVPNMRANVSASDTEDGGITSSITTTGSVSTTVAGVYHVTYNVLDSDNNTADPVTRVYVVGAITLQHDYAIFANNFSRTVGLVDSSDAAILSASSARAEHIYTRVPATVQVLDTGGYGAVPAIYTVSLNIAEDPSVVAPITATVVTGDIPVIEDATPVVELPLNGTAPTVLDNVRASDTEDGNITTDIVASGTVDMTTKGVYHVTYDVVDSDSNSAEQVVRAYVVGASGPVTGNYAIFGTDFTRRVGRVDTTDAAIIEAATATAVHIGTLATGTVEVKTTGGYSKTPAVYPITFAVAEEPATTGIQHATVVTGNVPVILDSTPVVELAIGASAPVLSTGVSASDVEDNNLTTSLVIGGETAITTDAPGIYHVTYDVEDSDENTAVQATRVYVVGANVVQNNYAIFANPFTKRVGEVDASHSAIILAAGAYGTNIQTKQTAPLSVVETSGYSNLPATYPLTFAITADTRVAANVFGTVVTGDKPVMSDATPVVSLALGAPAPSLRSNISASDTEDGNITGDITVGGESVNTAMQGIYHVTYDVIDSDTNSADTVTRVYVVDAQTVHNNYAIFANDFTKRVGEVNTNSGAIITAATARVQALHTKLEGTIQVKTAGGYSAVPADYTITFNVAEDMTVEAPITATVVTGDKPVLEDTTPVVELTRGATAPTVLDNITASDTEDGNITGDIIASGQISTAVDGVFRVTYTVVDSDGNSADSVTRVYTVGASVVAYDYAIFASDFTRSVGLVDTDNDAVILAANGRAEHLMTGAAGTLEVTHQHGYGVIPGSYDIDFQVAEDTRVNTTVVATVITGFIPTLIDTTPVVELPVGAPAPTVRADITASDIEDGDLTGDIIITGDTVDTNTKGIYHVTYDVVDSDSNSAVQAIRTYVVGASGPVTGNYAIFAEDFTKRVGQVNTGVSAITSAASAYAQHIHTGAVVTPVLQDAGEYSTTPGSYALTWTVATEPSTTGASQATVITGDKPVILDTTPVVELPLGAAMPTLGLNVSVSDTEDGTNLTGVTIAGQVDPTEKGVYKVTYDFMDSDTNSADTVTRTYVVGASGVSTTHALFGADFTKRVGQVDTSDTAIITAMGAYAINLTLDAQVAVGISDAGGYQAVVDTYAITYHVEEQPTATAWQQATVIAGDKPTLLDTTPVVELELGANAPTVLSAITASDLEDGDITGDISATGSVDTTTKGIYHVTYTVTDSDTNQADSVMRSYVVGASGHVLGNYAIFGHDFTTRVGVVDTRDAAVITSSGAYAQHIETLATGTIQVEALGGYQPAVGIYPITFNVAEEPTTKAVHQATVQAGDKPTLLDATPVVELQLGATSPTVLSDITASDTEDGDITSDITATGTVNTTTKGIYHVTYTVTDSDTNVADSVIRTYVVGASGEVTGNYAIFGADYSKRIGQVDTADSAMIRDATEYAQHIHTLQLGTIQVFDKGGYTASVGNYTVTYAVVEEPTTTGTQVATVVAGTKPTLFDATPVVELELNGTAPTLLADITASDLEDGDITDDITATGTVDMTTKGVYDVTYTVIDSDTNEADSVTRVYVVGASGPVTDYAIFSEDFAKRSGEVDTTHAAVITAAQATAVNIHTKTAATVEVKDLGGYSNIAASYTITFGIVEDATTVGTSVATVTIGEAPTLLDTTPRVELPVGAPAVDVRADITASDLEDGDITAFIQSTGSVDTTQKGIYHVTYDITDSDANSAATHTRVYVIGASGPLVGNYAIFGEDFTKRVGEVDTTHPAIIEAATVTAQHIYTYDAGTIAVAETSGYTTTVGTYPLTFNVVEEPATTGTQLATVVAGDKPTILDATPVVELELGATAPTRSADVSASDLEDGDITGDIQVSGTVDVNTKGIYHVTYDVMDSDSNSAVQAIRTYVVGASGPLTGNYAIFSADYSKRIGEVNTDHTAIIEATRAYAQHIHTLQPGTIQVDDIGNYQAVVGTYPLTLSVTEEPTTIGTQTVTVTTGEKPVLLDNTPVVTLPLGAETPTVTANITATDLEDGDSTPAISISGDTVDTTQKGIYHVTYNVTDSDTNQADQKTRVYVVGASGEVTDYAIFTEDFTRRAGEVDTTDSAVITAAQATAINIHTKAAATVTVKDLGGYSNTPETYNITFTVTEDEQTTGTSRATVKTGEKPTILDTTPIVDIALNTAVPDVTTNITARDTEDGDLTSAIIATGGPVDTTAKGLHVITYTVTDSDGNSATTKRVYVVGAVIVTTNYALFAEDFTIDEKDVNMEDKEGQIISKSILTNIQTNFEADEILENFSVGTAKVVDHGGYTNKAGNYPITLTIDEDPTKQAVIQGTVLDTTAPDAPIINPIEAGKTPTITGTGEPGSTIKVTFPDGSTVDTIVDEDGNWTVESPIDLEKDDVVTAISTDPSGNTSGTTEQIVGQTYSLDVKAENFTVYISEIEKQINDGTLEDFVLQQSNAEGILTTSEKQQNVGLKADTSKITEKVAVGDYLTPIFVTEGQINTLLGMENSSTSNTAVKSKEITVTIIDDPSNPALPVTGEATDRIVLFGMFITMTSLGITIRTRKNRKNISLKN